MNCHHSIVAIIAIFAVTVFGQVAEKCCPAVPSGTIGFCAELCNDCEAKNQLCCSNGCGHVCKDPVPCQPAVCNMLCTRCHSCKIIAGKAQCVPDPPSPDCPKEDPCSLVDCADCHSCKVINGEAQCVADPPSASCPNGPSCNTVKCAACHVCKMIGGQARCVDAPPSEECPKDSCAGVKCGKCHHCTVIDGKAQCVPRKPSKRCPCCCVGFCDPERMPDPCVNHPSCPRGK